MPLQEGYPGYVVIEVPTDVANTDLEVQIPYTGYGFALRRATAYDSRLRSTGATADNSLATLGIFTLAAGAGVALVANAALTTHTGNTIVSDRTVAAAALTPAVRVGSVFVRVGTASGVTGSAISLKLEWSVLD